MNAKRNTFSWGYFLLWLIGAFIGVVVGFTVFFVVMSLLGSFSGPIPVFAASLIMTGCFGTIIGLAQWSILRLFVQRSAVWIGFTLLGFLISSPVILSQSGGFGPVITSIGNFNMTVTLGSVLGLVQWFSIHRKVSWSTLWVGISLVCWVIAGWIGIALSTLSWESGPIFYWLGMFFAALLLSVFGMMLLFKIKADTGFSEKTQPDRPLWRRIMRLPGTRLGWWSVALAATYLVFFLLILPTLSGKVSWGQTAALLIVMARPLCAWAAGIAGLAALVEMRESSIMVWIAMVPALYFLYRLCIPLIDIAYNWDAISKTTLL